MLLLLFDDPQSSPYLLSFTHLRPPLLLLFLSAPPPLPSLPSPQAIAAERAAAAGTRTSPASSGGGGGGGGGRMMMISPATTAASGSYGSGSGGALHPSSPCWSLFSARHFFSPPCAPTSASTIKQQCSRLHLFFLFHSISQLSTYSSRHFFPPLLFFPFSRPPSTHTGSSGGSGALSTGGGAYYGGGGGDSTYEGLLRAVRNKGREARRACRCCCCCCYWRTHASTPLRGMRAVETLTAGSYESSGACMRLLLRNTFPSAPSSSAGERAQPRLPRDALRPPRGTGRHPPCPTPAPPAAAEAEAAAEAAGSCWPYTQRRRRRQQGAAVCFVGDGRCSGRGGGCGR